VQKVSVWTTRTSTVIQVQTFSIGSASSLESVFSPSSTIWPLSPTHQANCYEVSNNFPKQDIAWISEVE
jgi:hypothetical protein